MLLTEQELPGTVEGPTSARTMPPSLVRFLCVVLAPLPFWSIYLYHYAAPSVPTGFIQYEGPYYSANGRAIFERGNGFAYPNPYDPDPQAPVIYFHWLPWLLGFGITRLGWDPGLLYCGIGALAGLACSWFMLRLVETILPDARYRYALFFVVMWGGGVLCLWQAMNIALGRTTWSELFVYDPCWGWWFLNWGRNLVYPTEAVYHAIVAGTWLAAITQRRLLVLLGAVLLATTHPFSGLQLLLMLLAWFGIRTGIRRERADLWLLLALLLTLASFLGYYLVYLNSFAAHRELQSVWTLRWILPKFAILLAYGLVGVLALLRVLSDRGRLGEEAWFWVVCFAVSLFLAKHEWFLPAHQPLHFTRGYIWTPLCLLALPLIQRLLLHVQRATPASLFTLLVSVAACAAVSDNLAFIAKLWMQRDGLHLAPDERAQFYLTAEEAEAFQWMDRQGLDGILLCPDEKLSYLSATYTSVRPFFGHMYNTPHFRERRQQVTEWRTHGGEGSWFADIDYILLNRKSRYAALPGAGWEIAFENAQLVLYKRKLGNDSSSGR
jgi:hypothetical protein